MNHIKQVLFIALALTVVVFAPSCSKDIKELGSDWGQLAPSRLDTGAGNWKPVIVSATDTFLIPSPSQAGSSLYQDELADMILTTNNLTAEQRAASQ